MPVPVPILIPPNRRGRRAFTMVYAVMIFAVLGGITSLAVDFGHVQLTKTELQRAADAAARAALLQLANGVPAAQTAAVTVAGNNLADNTAVVLDTTNDIEFGTWDIPSRTFTVLTGAAEATANAIRITARRTVARGNPVSLVFGQLVGANTCDVTASAIAAMHTVALDYSSGFSGASSTIAVNNNAAFSGSSVQLTTNVNNQRGSAWFNQPVPVSAFSTTFTFQIVSGGTADGMAFCIQKNATTTIGTGAGYLGFGSMPNSCAVKFDIYSNAGEGTSSTGVYLNGAQPYNTNSFSTSGASVNLRGGNVMRCTLVYDGTTLSQTLVDTVTNATYTNSYVVNIPAAISGTTAYVGFTGATGGASAIQSVQTWTYTAPNAMSVVK